MFLGVARMSLLPHWRTSRQRSDLWSGHWGCELRHCMRSDLDSCRRFDVGLVGDLACRLAEDIIQSTVGDSISNTLPDLIWDIADLNWGAAGSLTWRTGMVNLYGSQPRCPVHDAIRHLQQRPGHRRYIAPYQYFGGFVFEFPSGIRVSPQILRRNLGQNTEIRAYTAPSRSLYNSSCHSP
jgi:hypothetical protein